METGVQIQGVLPGNCRDKCEELRVGDLLVRVEASTNLASKHKPASKQGELRRQPQEAGGLVSVQDWPLANVLALLKELPDPVTLEFKRDLKVKQFKGANRCV